MKKKLAILLALVMVLALVFVGCGDKKDDTKKTTLPASTEEAVIGTWAATVDFTDLLVDSVGDMDGMEDYIEFKDFDLKFVIEIKDDDTFTLSLDKDVAQASIEKIIDQMMDGMEDYVEAEAGMSFDEFLALMEMTRDEFEDAMKESMDIDTFDMSSKGTYTVDGDTIVLTEETDETTTLEYANGTLKIVDMSDVDAESEAMAEVLKSATFKKN